MDQFRALVLANSAPVQGRPSFVRSDALELVPVADKPILLHALDAFRDTGITEAAIVVHPRTAEEVRKAVSEGLSWRLRVRYIELPQRGVIEALLAARRTLRGARVVVYPAQGLLMAPLEPLLHEFDQAGLQALLALDDSGPGETDGTDPGEPAAAHSGALDGDPVLRGDRLTQALSDIAEGRPRSAAAGVHVLGPSVLAAATECTRSWRGRIELVQVIKRLPARARGAEGRRLGGWWRFDGLPNQLLEGNRLILDGLADRRGEVPADSVVEGRVSIDPSARLESVRILGPAIIGPGARLSDAFVGPYTSVGRHAALHGVEIENSLVMPHAEVRDIEGRIAGSVIGEGAVIQRDFSLPRVLELAVARESTAMLG